MITTHIHRALMSAIFLLVLPCAQSADLSLSPLPLAPQSREYATYASETRVLPDTTRQFVMDRDQVRRRTLGIILGNAIAVGAYGKQNWWQDGFNSSFHTASEGWFGQNTNSGGADKLGHFFANYAATRLFMHAFAWAGNDPGTSLRLAAITVLSTFTVVELLDGMTQKWSFSKEDALMNVFGVGAALVFEKNPALDRVLDLRLLYRRSSESQGFKPFGDYSGQTYLLVAKASGVPALSNHPWLRYLEVAVGYGTRGYATPPSAGGTPSRNLYFGISLNLSAILRDSLFRHSDDHSRSVRLTNAALEFVQVPGTAALHSYRLPSD